MNKSQETICIIEGVVTDRFHCNLFHNPGLQAASDTVARPLANGGIYLDYICATY